MESPKSQKEIAGRLTYTEQQRVRDLIKRLEDFLTRPQITEESFNDITNCTSELLALREVYLTRLLNVFKRGFVDV